MRQKTDLISLWLEILWWTAAFGFINSIVHVLKMNNHQQVIFYGVFVLLLSVIIIAHRDYHLGMLRGMN